MARREDRKPLAMNAQFRSMSERCEVSLWDLSSHGCRIVLTARLSLSPGRRIVLRPAGLEGLSGIVRWSNDEFAGVEFDYPLHPSVVDHLCRLHPDESRVAMELAA